MTGKKLNEPIYYESETRTQYISNYISTTTNAYFATTAPHKERGSLCVRESWIFGENKTMNTWRYSVTSFVTKEVAECDREYTPVLNILTNRTSQHADNSGSRETTWYATRGKKRPVTAVWIQNTNSEINPTMCTILLNIFISILHMFRASMCSSSGENCCTYTTLVLFHSVWVAFGLQTRRHPHRVTNTIVV